MRINFEYQICGDVCGIAHGFVRVLHFSNLLIFITSSQCITSCTDVILRRLRTVDALIPYANDFRVKNIIVDMTKTALKNILIYKKTDENGVLAERLNWEEYQDSIRPEL